MVKKVFTINNKLGLHVRPASVLANGVGRFHCDIFIDFGGQSYNAKSVINLMAACIKQGDTVEVRCDGSDEADAMKAIEQLVSEGLGE